MAELVPFPFERPGLLGLNLQARSTVLGPEWATVMDNLVIDEQGRMAVRKGTRAITDTGATATLQTVFTSYQSNGDTHVHAAASDGKLYNNATTATVLTNRSGAATLASDGHYKYQNFNGKVIAFHSDGRFLVQSTATGNFANITFALHTPPGVNDVLSAFGRLWIVTDTHLYWSNLLDETTWRTSGTATDAGFIQLATVWPGGADTGVALAEFNGNLVIFGSHSTVIYNNPDDPLSTMSKVEAIDGTGCLARDSVKHIGRDLIWVSNGGLKSLGRVIQEKSLPLNDSLPQIRDYLASAIAPNPTVAKAAYAEQDGLYVITTPTESFAVNVKDQLPDRSYRVTRWDSFGAPGEGYDGRLMLASGTKVYSYNGYTDGANSSGVGGSPITAEYQSGWIDFSTLDPSISGRDKVMKRMLASIYGGSEVSVTFKWAVDYVDTFGSAVKFLPASGTSALYGVASFGIDHYGTSFDINRISNSISNAGRVIKVGLLVSNVTTETAVNRMDLYAKIGKTRIT